MAVRTQAEARQFLSSKGMAAGEFGLILRVFSRLSLGTSGFGQEIDNQSFRHQPFGDAGERR